MGFLLFSIVNLSFFYFFFFYFILFFIFLSCISVVCYIFMYFLLCFLCFVGFSPPELMWFNLVLETCAIGGSTPSSSVPLSDFDSVLVATTFGWLLQFPSGGLKRVARPLEICALLCPHFASVAALGNSTKRTRLFVWPIFYYLFVFLHCYFCFRSVIGDFTYFSLF
jgi:hypothetical protein